MTRRTERPRTAPAAAAIHPGGNAASRGIPLDRFREEPDNPARTGRSRTEPLGRIIRQDGQMPGPVRRVERPADSKRMLSFVLFTKGAILLILVVIVALQAEWLAALGTLGLGLLTFLARGVRSSSTTLSARRLLIDTPFGSAPAMEHRPPPTVRALGQTARRERASIGGPGRRALPLGPTPRLTSRRGLR